MTKSSFAWAVMFLKFREISTIVLLFLVLLWAFYLADSAHVDWERSQISREVQQRLGEKAELLATSLNSRISLLYGVKSFVEADPDEERLEREFDHIAQSIAGDTRSIRAVQLVRDGRIRYLWPIEGNQSAFGHDLLHDARPSVRHSVAHALLTDSVVLNDPIELIQGGLGVVARLRLRNTDGTVWGLAAIVMDIPAILEETGMKERDDDLRYALSSDDGTVFFGDPGLLFSSPERRNIALIGDRWTIVATPTEGWESLLNEKILMFRIAAGIIVLLLLAVLIMSIRNRFILKTLVDRRTRELRHVNEELRLEVDERIKISEDLKTALVRAEQSDRMKDAFIATMSHEIRTPLHVIIGYVNLLGGATEAPASEHGTYMLNIRTAANRLMRTVEQLLQLSRLRTGAVTVTRELLDLAATVEPMVRELGVMATDRGLHIEFDALPGGGQILADRFCLEQAVSNLIDNAIKYTKVGFVRVQTEGDESTARIVVRDSGIGIGEEYLERLYKPFTQEISGYARPYDGLGLGLALTQRYVELNHGAINVSSVKGKGTVVTLSFQRAEKQA